MEIIKKYFTWLLVGAMLIVHFIPKGAIKEYLSLALWIIIIPLFVYKIIKGFKEDDTKANLRVLTDLGIMVLIFLVWYLNKE
jgi:hypothetical protein